MGESKGENRVLTVRELVRKLSKCDPDAIVVRWHDDEGNGFDGITSVEKAGKRMESEFGARFVILGETDFPVLW